MKPIQRGYKMWCLCDSTNGYLYNMALYTGATGSNNEDSLSSRVVQNLVQPLYGANHHIYMDNYFSSIPLALKLAENSTYTIGTMRTGRKHWPVEFKNIKVLTKNMQRGESVCKLVQGIQCIVWKDNKGVAFLNNVADPIKQTHVPRRNKDGTRSQIPRSEAVNLYNKHMGGVDVFDSRRKTYSCSRKSKKWWVRIYYFLLDTAIANAYILYRETPATKKLTHQEFVLSIIEHLFASPSSRKRQACSQPSPAGRLQGRHFPYKTNKASQCRICRERKRTTYTRKDCCPKTPVPLCPAPCFGIYHTKQSISRK
jgi:hypothetical protein